MGTRILSTLLTLLSAYTLLTPLLCILLGINELIRFLLRVYLLLTRSPIQLISDGIENLYPTDSGGSGGIILGVFVSPDNGAVNLAQEQIHFERSVLQKRCPDGRRTYARLESCLTRKWGYGCRVKKEFWISNHVKLYDSQPSNKEFFTKSELLQEILPTLSKHFDFSTKPGWEWVIVPRVALDEDQGLSVVRIFRLHHSYMDGMSAGVMVSECLLNFGKDTHAPPPFILDPKAGKSGGSGNLLQNLGTLIQLPYLVMRTLLRDKDPERDPISARASQGLSHWGFTKKIDFSRIRDLRTALTTPEKGVPTTTNVLGCVVLSALGQSLSEHGPLPPNSEVVCGGPTAILPHSNSRPRNQVLPSRVHIPLRSGTLLELVEITGGHSVSLRLFAKVLGRLPGKLIQFGVTRLAAKFPTSTIITSIPTLRVRGCWESGEVVGEIGGFSGVSTGIGLSVVAMSYGTELRFWVVVDDVVMSKAQLERFLELLTVQKC